MLDFGVMKMKNRRKIAIRLIFSKRTKLGIGNWHITTDTLIANIETQRRNWQKICPWALMMTMKVLAMWQLPIRVNFLNLGKCLLCALDFEHAEIAIRLTTFSPIADLKN